MFRCHETDGSATRSRVGPHLEGGWAQTGATGTTALVREVHPCDDPRVGADRSDDRCEVAEHELCAAHHRERTVIIDVTPRQIHEPLAAGPLDGRSAKVDSFIAVDDIDLRMSERRDTVSRNDPDRFTTRLQADMQIRARLPRPAREMMPLNLQLHAPTLSLCTLGSCGLASSPDAASGARSAENPDGADHPLHRADEH